MCFRVTSILETRLCHKYFDIGRRLIHRTSSRNLLYFVPYSRSEVRPYVPFLSYSESPRPPRNITSV